MPQVPRYEQVSQERPLPNARANGNPDLAAFGGGPALEGVTRGAVGLASEWQKFNQQQRDQADKVWFDQRKADLNRWEIENVYDTSKGAASTVGEQAFGIGKTLDDSLNKFSEDQKKQIPSERQKLLFDGLVNERRGSVLEWAAKHTAQQTEVVKKASHENLLDTTKDVATLDPLKVPGAIQTIEDEVVSYNKGALPPEVVAQEIKKHVTDLHDRVISSYLSSGRDGLAEVYYTKNRENIDPDKQAPIEEKIRVGTERIKKKRREDLELSALNVIEQTGDFSKLPNEVVAILPRESRSALRTYAKTISNGEEVETDLPTYYGLSRMSDDELKNVNLVALSDRLSPTDFKSWAKIQRDIRGGKKSSELDGYRTNQQIVSDVLMGAHIDPTPDAKKNKKDADRVALFHAVVDEKIMDLQRQTGKKATNDDVQKIADGLILQGAVEGTGIMGFGRKKKRVFQVNKGEELVAKRGDIPESEVGKILAALTKLNMDVTDEAIVSAYNKKLRKLVNEQ